ncbi:MAG: TspO/MBR family protein [Fimbriimonadaceae bacterium]
MNSKAPSVPVQGIALILCIAFSFLAALGGVSGSPDSTWFQNLEKPAFQPPNWLFGPVWSLLYLLIGISLWLVWRRGVLFKDVKLTVVFAVQWFLNLLWSVLFFGLENILLAQVGIVVLLGFIIWTIALFWKVDRWAGILLIPYLLWVSFATFLTATLFALN